MSLTTIGETVVSKIIEHLVEKATSFVGEKLLPQGDTEAEIERLQDALPQIKAVLEVVESNQIKTHSKALDAWLWRFRDAVECAEDVLDELAYYDLEEKVQAQNDQVSSSLSGYKRKFVNCVSGKYKSDTLTRLAKAVQGLDKAVVGVNNFLNLEKISRVFQSKNFEDVKQNDDRETGSLLTESVVFGRDKERDLIVEWLTADSFGGENSTGNTCSLSAFTILGIGGMGKTTLAQLICKDERVRTFFDPIVWVCVSYNFDAVEIITKILEVITNERPTVRSLASLQNNLKELLVTKKILVVLDDVWNDENISQWENLLAPLKFGHARSRVLVTSRMESVSDMVAKVIEGTKKCHKLEGLKGEEFLALFNQHAFAGKDPNEFKNLHPIGKQITEKLGGCPLAAKIMGGVLNYSMEFDYWNRMLKEDIPNYLSGMNDIMVVLRLSYNRLPTHLQVCFRYCSIFPKDFHFKKDELIKMWMGSGLIDPRHKRGRPEDIGNEYFNRLVRKSFFEKSDNISFGGYYVMHDLLHDLATSISEGECLRIEEDFRDVPKTIRHLQLQTKSVHAMQKITHLSNLRTLCITFENWNDNDEMKIVDQIIKHFKSLRLLSLTGKNLQTAPDAIGELIHLRYLSFCRLSRNEKIVPWLPPSTYRLYHLEVLQYFHDNCQCIGGIIEPDICNLINLRYLHTHNSSTCVCKIPAIGKLSCLQELNAFYVRVESGYQINELGSLNSLRSKLCIMNLDKVSSYQQAKEARLSEKEYLKELELHWTLSHISSEEYYKHLLDNLQPHVNLEKLRICKYGGVRPPVWMDLLNLVNLTSLVLEKCYKLSILPALGSLPLLKYLTLRSLPKVKKVDHTFYGSGEGHYFPVLEELIFEELEEWEELVEVGEGVVAFQRLKTLYLKKCPKLRKLLSLPASLRNLQISNVGIDILPRIYESITNGILTTPSSLSFLRVCECSHLISLGECLLQQGEHAHALTKLHIEKCFELMHLGSLIDLKSLRELQISHCPKLWIPSGTQQNLFPFSLQDLYIENCGLEIPMVEFLRNLTLLKELTLIECPKLTRLPSADVLSALTALSSLSIVTCNELVSLDGLGALTSLRCLTIMDCDKLVALSSSQPLLQTDTNTSINAHLSSLMLEELQISHSSLLNLEPLRNLEFTKKLFIFTSVNFLPEEWLLQNRNSLEVLFIHDASNLEHLPASIERMQFLKKLFISSAKLIQSLPDFPSSLRSLYLDGCHPLLKERYKDDSCAEWYKIARIPSVHIF